MHLRTVIRATVVNAKHRWDGATNPVQLVIVTRERESKDLDGTIVPVDFPEEFMKGFDYSNIWGFSSTALAPLMWLLARMCSDKLEGKKLVTKKKKKILVYGPDPHLLFLGFLTAAGTSPSITSIWNLFWCFAWKRKMCHGSGSLCSA